MNIIDALDSPHLFARHFGNPETWAAWRVFLRAAFGLPMPEADLERFRHHTGRTAPPTAPHREVALICGRRGGKSRVLATTALFLAMRDYDPYLAPGEVATIPIIAADRRQARTIFRYVRGLIDGTPTLAAMKLAETGESIELSNRVVIEIHTATFRGVRGYTLGGCLVDEVAFLRDEASANPDTELLAAVRPGLSSIPGAMLLVASSPYAKRGALYTLFRDHWGRDGARVLVWRGTSLEMNPTLDPEIVAQAREDDPARASAEYDAQFRDDVAGYVDREIVDACVVPGRHELPPISSCRYVAFVDPSGGSQDSMTLAIAHRDGDRPILDAVREVRPPFSPEAVVDDFAALLARYRVREVTGDRYAGEWPREQFRKRGVEYRLSDRPRSDIYRDLLPLLNSHTVELLDLPRLMRQLCDLERRTARGGRDSIDHAPGAHDDVANAAAGALLLVGREPPTFFVDQELLDMIGRDTDFFPAL